MLDHPNSNFYGELSFQRTALMVFEEYIERVRVINQTNGWFDENRTVGDEIALLHSEVSEAFEQYREIGLETRTLETGKPDDFNNEIADIFIRLFDVCFRHDILPAKEIDRKLRYNVTRGYKHGGKRI